jgi:hypothetical protein
MTRNQTLAKNGVTKYTFQKVKLTFILFGNLQLRFLLPFMMLIHGAKRNCMSW